jgi:hypothetical protein
MANDRSPADVRATAFGAARRKSGSARRPIAFAASSCSFAATSVARQEAPALVRTTRTRGRNSPRNPRFTRFPTLTRRTAAPSRDLKVPCTVRGACAGGRNPAHQPAPGASQAAAMRTADGRSEHAVVPRSRNANGAIIAASSCRVIRNARNSSDGACHDGCRSNQPLLAAGAAGFERSERSRRAEPAAAGRITAAVLASRHQRDRRHTS